MAAVEETGIYKTGDMIEASILSMHGLTPSFESAGDSRAVFVFILREQDDPEFIEGLIDDIRSSKCQVEPKRFARELKHVREALYDFLRVDRDRLRLRHN